MKIFVQMIVPGPWSLFKTIESVFEPAYNIYIKIDNDKLLILVVYVDDIIFGSNEEAMTQALP